MKKIILFIVIILIFITAILYSTYFKDFLALLDENKVYKIENINEIDINTLEEYGFFDRGILTYNNKKILYTDFNNKILWEKANIEFSNQVFIAKDYIFRQTDKNIIVTDKNNQEFIIAEINGNIINVSRENGKTVLIVKGNGQTLYIMDDNNEIVVDSKEFKDIITGISISDRSEAYSIMTLTFENGAPLNTLYFNLIGAIELWSTTIENEILIKTKVINNNVLVLGTDNIYFYNNNGKLMWKNSIYNKILDYEVSNENQRINVLFDKGSSNEFISYNFEGRVMEIQEAPSTAKNLIVYDNKVLVHNNSSIFLLHSNKSDKIFGSSDNFKDILIDGNNIYLLYKSKIIKGQIK